jgi:hypothetical protein
VPVNSDVRLHGLAMNKHVNPPKEVEAKLEETLRRRYPDLEAREDVFRSVEYTSGKPPLSTYRATVTYFVGTTSSVALFEYQEDRQTRTRIWYCSHDWAD